MIQFSQIPQIEIYMKHNNHFYEDACYFQIAKKDKPLCIYGVRHIDAVEKTIAETFWILDSFNKNVLSKTFFYGLFDHLFSLGFREIYTWTRCKKLINVFGHFKNMGIEKVSSPAWDNDDTKTWFRKRV